MRVALTHLIAMSLKCLAVALLALTAWALVSRWMNAWDYSPWAWRVVGRKSREHMARDYLAKRVVPSMHVGQVLEDLGPPDWTTDPDEGLEAERLVYVVGGRYMYFGSETVSIYFDADNQGLVTESGFRR